MTNDVAMLDGGPLIEPGTLPAVLGWTLEAKGLCRGDVCVPVADPDALHREGKLDVTAVAAALDRPALHDEESGLVAIGAPREQRRAALDLHAPDFELPDVDGTPVAFSSYRGKKRLLAAFASW